jgi:site-specific recombinase XerD
VFLPEHFAPLLAEHLARVPRGPVFGSEGGLRLTVRHANRRLAEYFRKAEVRRVAGSHVLRHTFATGLYRRTGDLLLVKRALCHRSVASTQVYADADNQRLREAVAGQTNIRLG